jgi:molybdopterin molybdotransferase
MAQNQASSVSIEEHLSRILGMLDMLPVSTVGLSEAHGRVLAEEVTARAAVPAFANSAMDGYAVHRSDVAGAEAAHPVALRVVADVPAGSSEDPVLGAGDAARIMTGAPVPTTADAVIAQESTDYGRRTVMITAPADSRGNIRPAGSDVRAGESVLTPGRVLDSRDIAAAIAAGADSLRVRPAPRVAVLSTGDELIAPGATPGRGQIPDSNSYLLEAAVIEAGGIPVRVGAVPDDPDRLRGVFERLAGTVDAFVTSGGVSVGDFDVVKKLLQTTESFWFGLVRMQPGKPQGFGHWRDGTPIFCLPGNPVSVFVSFETFVRPALRRMQGCRQLHRRRLAAVAVEGWRSPAGRAQRMPVAIVPPQAGQSTQTLMVQPAARGGAASHLVAGLAGADAVALIPEDVTEVAAGDPVEVIVVKDL